MKLSILIPTYNRAPFLLKNLKMLSDYIRKGTLQEEIEIVVSNNKSTDNTDEKVIQFQNKNTDIQLQYFTQDENIGLEKNALFVLRQAKGEYVMYLGDDDYIEEDYLFNSFSHITSFSSTYVIIPNFIPINIDGIQIGRGRDDHQKSKLYLAGFNNCLENSWRGHQLSGLILKRGNLYSTYTNNKVGNLYPFIYFVSYLCLHGNTYHFTEFPVKVTQPGQEKKDWNYGKDGLFNEIFDNYKKLPISVFQKTKLQIKIYKQQPDRFWMYKKKGLNFFIIAFFSILFSQNSTLFFKLIFPFVVFFQILKVKK